LDELRKEHSDNQHYEVKKAFGGMPQNY